MLSKIQQFFNDCVSADKQSLKTTSPSIEVAAAALLIEVSRADFSRSSDELKAIEQALKQTFTLDNTQLTELIDEAEDQNSQATSLFEFTDLINKHYDQTDKLNLLVALWQVAFADGELDKYEEHLIRKIANLLYVPHSGFIQAKLQAVDKRR